MSISDSTTINGYSVTVHAGVTCWVAYKYYFAKLDDLSRDGQLEDKEGKHWAVSQDTINLISNWARARGYTKERHRVRTQAAQSAARRKRIRSSAR